MREYVVFKGSKNGLQLVFDESADFKVVLEHLKQKLDSAVGFFTTGATVEVPLTARVLSAEQQDDLSRLLSAYGLTFRETSATAKPAEADVCLHPDTTEAQTLFIGKTLRGGQEVVYSGSVVILGDVNPGAEVIAGGDIVIRGTCRGVVHAGAYGNMKATISANRLLASQIRIAGLIARSPDHMEVGQPSEGMETARIEEGNVIIESAEL